MSRKSSTETLIAAMRILARDIQSDDGVANAAIAEAADRLEELHADHLRDAKKMVEQQARINALLTERNRFGVDIQGAALAGRVQEGHQLEPQLRLVARIGDELRAAKARIAELELANNRAILDSSDHFGDATKMVTYRQVACTANRYKDADK